MYWLIGIDEFILGWIIRYNDNDNDNDIVSIIMRLSMKGKIVLYLFYKDLQLQFTEIICKI